ncbi:MAG: FKBP-type peptidyl-prolyl cis-trans isomerase N-terminal domain-containing protein, partial [Ginsengibacter sp.]
MKKGLIAICAGMALFGNAQTKKMVVTKKSVPAKVSITPGVKNSLDSFSYAIGVQGASFYKSQGADKVNVELVKKAFDDVFNNKTLLLTTEICNMTVQNKMQEFMSSKATSEKEAGKNFLEENKKRPGVIELPNGLQYEILKAGTGEKPKATDTVKAHYAGSLINGQEFDNSYKRGEPLEIPVSGVIQGWVQALQMMPVG